MDDVDGDVLIERGGEFAVMGPAGEPDASGEGEGGAGRIGRLNCVQISGSVRITTDTEGPLEVGDANCVEIRGDIEIKAIIRPRGKTGPIEDPAGAP